MAKIDAEYHKLLDKILQEGYTYEDPNRKGVNRLEIPSYTFRHEFKDGFPAITTKKLHYKNVVTELIWFLRGDTNIKYLVDNGCNIWNKDAYNYYLKQAEGQPEGMILTFKEWLNEIKEGEDLLGDLGKVYGHYWRNFDGVDQIAELIDNMINKPMSSELIVSARNPSHKDNQALPCCHYGFQIVMRPLSYQEKFDIFNSNDMMKRMYPGLSTKRENQLDNLNIPKYGFELHWQQRSVDTFLGLPFNIASYATLALILEKITGYKALAIQGDLKKVHLYDNSLDAVKEQLSRDTDKYGKCELRMDVLTEVQFEKGIKHMNEIEPESFKLINYESYPPIKCKMLERDE